MPNASLRCWRSARCRPFECRRRRGGSCGPCSSRGRPAAPCGTGVAEPGQERLAAAGAGPPRTARDGPRPAQTDPGDECAHPRRASGRRSGPAPERHPAARPGPAGPGLGLESAGGRAQGRRRPLGDPGRSSPLSDRPPGHPVCRARPDGPSIRSGGRSRPMSQSPKKPTAFPQKRRDHFGKQANGMSPG
jgi:hypothetical protein